MAAGSMVMAFAQCVCAISRYNSIITKRFSLITLQLSLRRHLPLKVNTANSGTALCGFQAAEASSADSARPSRNVAAMADPQKKAAPASQLKPVVPETPYRTDGTRLFRLVNFELFAVRPQFDHSGRACV
jgi:hypothetical protein